MDMKHKNHLTPLLVIVALNYLAQIPYDIHQYQGRFNPVGTLLLLITLIWFLAGYGLIQKKVKIGYWLLLSFLITQVIFYFQNEVVLSFYGYGMMYHFLHSKDWILWLVFAIGDLNFFAACFYSFYLLRNKTLFR